MKANHFIQPLNRIKILAVFGTRPEVIKMAPVIKELRKHPDEFICRVCVTAQHRQMIDSLLKLFDIKPDYDLNIMQENQTLEHITTTVLAQLGEIIKQEKPDYLVVQGDTTTAMAASLAAFYQKAKIAHVEAGLRTWNKLHPYPEEINRKIIDSVSDLCFAHTEQAKQNLLQEGIAAENIEVTGNTVIDALLGIARREFDSKGTVLENIPFNEKRIILVTAHRRENFGQPLTNICNAIKAIAMRYPDAYIVYPVHPNPNVQKPVYSMLNGIENVLLIEPLDYEYFVQLMKRSYLILTDSGGLQEEAPSLGKPVLVLREVTERPEAVEAGTAQIVGTQPERIIEKTMKLLEDKGEYERMSKAINPYGDGKASERIVARLLKE
jgi:UDP-N-acetylglucosamine 2-epimerase (non-hydrolysing)